MVNGIKVSDVYKKNKINFAYSIIVFIFGVTKQKNIMNANVLKSLDYIKDELKRGLIDATEANIRLVEAERFRIVRNKLPRDVRSALSQAVKQGRLVRVAKTQTTPEYYYKPNFEYLAKEQLYKDECAMIRAMKSICG